MARLPALRLLLPFAAGVLLCDSSEAPVPLWIALAAAALVAWRWAAPVAELALGVALGGLVLAVRLYAPLPGLAPGAPSATLELLEAPRRSGPLCSAVVRVLGPLPGRALLRAADSVCGLGSGDRVRARLAFEEFRPATNPGARSPRRAWRRRGVHRVARVIDGLQVGVATRSGGSAYVDAARRRVGDALDAAPAARAGGLLRALVTGQRDRLDPALRELFQQTGTAHLLAVSGLHVACVYASAALAVRWVAARVPWLSWVRAARTLGVVAGVCTAAGYAALSGLGVPALRAAAMAVAGSLAVLYGRPAASANALGLAALLILAVDPASLFDPGFALSFSAVAGILVWRPPTRGLAALLHATLAAGLATAPWAAALGLPLPAGGPLANLFAVPLFGFVVVPLGLLTGLLGSMGADALRPLCLVVTELALRALDAFRSPDLLAAVASPQLFAAASAACGFALRGAWLLGSRSLLAAAGGAAALASVAALPPANEALVWPELLFLDVGHGDAVLVRSGSAAWLVDAGPSLGAFDAGARVVWPALRTLGVRRLDVLAVTHADRDHAGGAISILSRVDVGELWLSAAVARHPVGRALLRTAALRRVPIRVVARGQRARLGELAVSVSWPPRDAAPGAGNEGSLVLRFQGAHGCALLPGDIPGAVERQLARAAERCALLKLAHHGSRSSSDAAWLERLRPMLAVASAGRRRRGALPHPEVRARLEAGQVTVYVTREHGAVEVSFTPYGLVAAPFLP